MRLTVSVLSPRDVIFEGQANSVILPGEQGVFEVVPYHKRILSRLLSGAVIIDGEKFFIQRGIVKVNQNRVDLIVEET